MFKSLSLLKQLLVVILGLAIMLVAVVMPVVDSNVHDIIDDQMYEKLETSQRNTVEYDFMPSNNKITYLDVIQRKQSTVENTIRQKTKELMQEKLIIIVL